MGDDGKSWGLKQVAVIHCRIKNPSPLPSMDMNSTLFFLREGTLSRKLAMRLPLCPHPDFLLVQSDLTNLTSVTMQVD